MQIVKLFFDFLISLIKWPCIVAIAFGVLALILAISPILLVGFVIYLLVPKKQSEKPELRKQTSSKIIDSIFNGS